MQLVETRAFLEVPSWLLTSRERVTGRTQATDLYLRGYRI